MAFLKVRKQSAFSAFSAVSEIHCISAIVSLVTRWWVEREEDHKCREGQNKSHNGEHSCKNDGFQLCMAGDSLLQEIVCCRR